MPIEGKFYESEELQLLLGVTKQRISNLFGVSVLRPGLYAAEAIEPYLINKNIRPETLPVRTFDHPAGVAFRHADEI